MLANGYLQLALYFVVLTALAKPLGAYMARVYEGKPLALGRVLGPLERLVYRVCGVRPDEDMSWTKYAGAMLAFNFVGFLAVYALQRLQGFLPWNPADLGPPTAHMAFNTAVSFATNTNWQSYGGETTLSYFTQMLGLTVQNFVSAASGMAILAAMIRGFVRRQASGIGNFWADMTRSTLYVLLPLSLVLALVLASQGVVQTMSPYARDHARRAAPPRRTAARSPSRRSPSAPPPRRSPSSSWAPTAAASSTSTRRIRSRTRPRSRTSSSCCRSW